MTLIASDGFEYADLAHRLIGQRLDNDRNKEINFRRGFEGDSPEEVRAYIEGYDRETSRPRTWRERLDAWFFGSSREHAYPDAPHAHFCADAEGRRAVQRYKNPDEHTEGRRVGGGYFTVTSAAQRTYRQSRGAGGACLAYLVPTPLAAFRAAYKSAVSRWLGP